MVRTSMLKKTALLVTVLGVTGMLVWVGTTVFQLGTETIDKMPDTKITIKGQEIIAKTPISDTQLAKGLMGVASITDTEGMLFIFPNSDEHAFWMYNTLIYLDILWLNENKEIVYISKYTPTCQQSNPLKCPTYKSDKPAKYVLELNSGWADRFGVKIGDSVSF